MLRSVDALIEVAGFAVSRESRASPQTLRNTFAADLFETGVDPEQVGQWLGFAQPVSASRLHRAWQTWSEQQETPIFSEPDPAAPPPRTGAQRGRSG